MSNVLTWIKANVFIVVFIGVMVIALVAFPMFAASMNAKIKADAQARGKKNTLLDGIRKASLDFGAGEPVQVLPTPTKIEAYRELLKDRQADAQKVQELAARVNRKDRRLLEPSLFPAPPVDQREVLPEQFHRKLMAAYRDLLVQAQAGMPPAPESVRQQLEQASSRFRVDDLKKGEAEALTPEEQEELRQVLSKVRRAQYIDAAEKVKLYAGEESLAIPQWTQGSLPRLMDLFNWQWQYWIAQDVLSAIAKVNGSAGSVVNAPVKRLISLRPLDSFAASSSSSSSSGSGPGLGGSRGRRRPAPAAVEPPPDEGGDAGDGSGSGASAAAAPLPSEAALNFGASWTGRQSNSLYDVRLVELRLVVRSRSLIEVMDALSRENFITVLDVEVRPIDSYTPMNEGFFYGDVPCSEVTLVLETVWLREWMTPLMPDDLRNVLGIPAPAAAAASR